MNNKQIISYVHGYIGNNGKIYYGIKTKYTPI